MNIREIQTPIGIIKICEENNAITAVNYMGNVAVTQNGSSPLLVEAQKQIEEYFSGERTQFELPLKISGTEFTQKVLLQLAKIPYGQTVTYGQLAQLCGNAKAARAVGTVMRKNPFMLVLPCHRVLPAGGKIGSYSAGGPANKEWLLTFERQNSDPFALLKFIGNFSKKI